MSDKFLLTCIDCGKPFFTEGEKEFYEARHFVMPKRCKSCRSIRKAALAAKQQAKANDLLQKEEQHQINRLLSELPYATCFISDLVIPCPAQTLYIISNGFDLMHGVPSSYYRFRDFLGKRSQLRRKLELWNLKEDLWADFEDSLAHMDHERMIETLPDHRENMGVIDEDDDDFSAADFFIAIESSIEPLQIIQRELPSQFRKWINTLYPSNPNRPLISLLHHEGKYLTFNYTEFVETLYAIPPENVFYIHGDRRNKNQKLILGHALGAEYEPPYLEISKQPAYTDQTSYDLHEIAYQYVGDYYNTTTKDSSTIIHDNQDYFHGLKSIKDIIIIGHSLSSVDFLYFEEIMKNCPEANWSIGWHSSSDLKRIHAFINDLSIAPEKIKLFQT